MASSGDSDQKALQEQAYAFSLARVAEQILINVLSAIGIGLWGAIGSLFLLLFQQIANYVVVPTNVLVAIVFFGLGGLVVAAGLFVLLNVFIRRLPPMAIVLGVMGLLTGLAFASGNLGEILRKTTAGVNLDEEAVKAKRKSTQGTTDSGQDTTSKQ